MSIILVIFFLILIPCCAQSTVLNILATLRFCFECARTPIPTRNAKQKMSHIILTIYNTVMFDTAQLAWANLCIHERFLSGLSAQFFSFPTFPNFNFNFLKPIWLIRMEIVQQLSPALFPYDMLMSLRGSRVGIRTESSSSSAGTWES